MPFFAGLFVYLLTENGEYALWAFVIALLLS
jgi:hypothetical protein